MFSRIADFHLSFPVADIWVPLPEARRVAQELDVLDELAALLEWETRAAWSVEDKEEGGLVHKCVSLHAGSRPGS